VLMLPWPLRIDAEDFKPTGAVEGAEFEPHGFFEFAPGELLDLDLADRVLQSARDQEGSVEIVVLPESALRPGDIHELEALLTRHRVWLFVAGVREPPDPGGRFGANWLHLGASRPYRRLARRFPHRVQRLQRELRRTWESLREWASRRRRRHPRHRPRHRENPHVADPGDAAGSGRDLGHSS
jgi:hypothetical protein